MSHPYPYLPADVIFTFMDNDRNLSPIHYTLPECASFEETEGYGLAPEDQYWRRQEMSQKLKELNDDFSLTPSQKHKIIEDNHSYYADEIAFIKKDIHRRKFGMSLFVKGKQYFIPPAFYFWLQWWRIEGKPVEYRFRDWESWMFDYMVDNDENILGTNYPKHRREGCTNRRKCKAYFVAISTPYAHCGMQSKDELHAKEIHEKMLMPVWREHIPFWHKPIWNGQNNDTSSINFTSPIAVRNPDYGKKALNSSIDFRNSGEKAYDGMKLRDLFNDEIGKTVEVDVSRRMQIQTQCLMEGSTIIGKMFNGSTVDDMERGGGANFKKICENSYYHQRNELTGRTANGLVNFFIPACEGFDGKIPKELREKFGGAKRWIDKYGFDVLDPETGRPAAETYLFAQRADFEARGDSTSLIELTRQFPLHWKECWRIAAKECNFNMAILTYRLEELEEHNPFMRKGFFEWENNIRDTKVRWVDDEKGRFNLSYHFPDPRMENAFFMDDGFKVPANTRAFCAGADPFKTKLTSTDKKSDGGGAVFMKHDINIDPPGKDISEYRTNRFVCTYRHRHNEPKKYFEDMLMMCFYFGCKLNPEMNVPEIAYYFEERGYGRYLFYPADPLTGKQSEKPGYTTSPKIIEEIFSQFQYHIQHFGHNEVHEDLLKECLNIEQDMGDFDLFVAAGYALLGAERNKFVEKEQTQQDINEIFRTFYHN